MKWLAGINEDIGAIEILDHVIMYADNDYRWYKREFMGLIEDLKQLYQGKKRWSSETKAEGLVKSYVNQVYNKYKHEAKRDFGSMQSVSTSDIKKYANNYWHELKFEIEQGYY